MEVPTWTVRYQEIPDIPLLLELFCFFLYFYILLVISTSKKPVFRSPFYVLFLLGGISDLILAVVEIFMRISRRTGLCYGWENWQNLASAITGSNPMIHIFINMMITVYQLTIVAVPLRHKQLWNKKNYIPCVITIIFISIALNVHAFFCVRTYTITNGFCSSTAEFGKELRFFAAFSVIIFEVNCFVLSPFTLYQMLKMRRKQTKDQRKTQEAGLACFALINAVGWLFEFICEFSSLIQLDMKQYWLLKIIEEQWYLNLFILAVLNAPVLLLLSGALRKEIVERWTTKEDCAVGVISSKQESNTRRSTADRQTI